MNRRDVVSSIVAFPFASTAAAALEQNISPCRGSLTFDIAGEIRNHLSPLPDGVYVNQDINTRVVYIHTNSFGFCITEMSIVDGGYLEGAKLGLRNLLVAEENARYIAAQQGKD